MAVTTFADAQTRAHTGGYSIEKSKRGYVGALGELEFEDEDLDALLDDMDALAEIAASEVYVFEDEETEDGDSQVSVRIGEKTHTFAGSVAEALAQAKAAYLEAQPKPAAAKGGRRRKVAAETLEPEPEAAVAEPVPGGDILAPIVSGSSPALIYTINTLINALQSIRANLAGREGPAEAETVEEAPRKRRGRRNGA